MAWLLTKVSWHFVEQILPILLLDVKFSLQELLCKMQCEARLFSINEDIKGKKSKRGNGNGFLLFVLPA